MTVDNSETPDNKLIFSAGKKKYGMPVSEVIQIFEITAKEISQLPIPCDRIYGMLNIAGAPVTLISPFHIEINRVSLGILASYSQESFAFLVDEVDKITNEVKKNSEDYQDITSEQILELLIQPDH